MFLPLLSTPITVCILTPILPLLLLSFVDFTFLPLLFRNEASFYTYSVTAHNSVKEDNFALVNIPLLFLNFVNIPLFATILQQHFNNNMNKKLTEFEQHQSN